MYSEYSGFDLLFTWSAAAAVKTRAYRNMQMEINRIAKTLADTDRLIMGVSSNLQSTTHHFLSKYCPLHAPGREVEIYQRATGVREGGVKHVPSALILMCLARKSKLGLAM